MKERSKKLKTDGGDGKERDDRRKGGSQDARKVKLEWRKSAY